MGPGRWVEARSLPPPPEGVPGGRRGSRVQGKSQKDLHGPAPQAGYAGRPPPAALGRRGATRRGPVKMLVAALDAGGAPDQTPGPTSPPPRSGAHPGRRPALGRPASRRPTPTGGPVQATADGARLSVPRCVLPPPAGARAPIHAPAPRTPCGGEPDTADRPHHEGHRAPAARAPELAGGAVRDGAGGGDAATGDRGRVRRARGRRPPATAVDRARPLRRPRRRGALRVRGVRAAEDQRPRRPRHRPARRLRHDTLHVVRWYADEVDEGS